MKRHKHQIRTHKLDNEVFPWWTMFLGPALKWVGFSINSTNEFGKIHKYT
jgi:hypothetical protein